MQRGGASWNLVLNPSLTIAHFFGCFLGGQTNGRINHIHERTLRVVYDDEISPFQELLGRDNSETILRRNIKILAAEEFKIKNSLSNNIIAHLICKRNIVVYRKLSHGFLETVLVESVEIAYIE